MISTIRSPGSASTARGSLTKWSSTKTCIGSATSEAPRAYSSGWPSESADVRHARTQTSLRNARHARLYRPAVADETFATPEDAAVVDFPPQYVRVESVTYSRDGERAKV